MLAALRLQGARPTSSGFAFTLGRLDGNVTLDEIVDHVTMLDQATDLPLSVDLENGYGPEPESAALAVQRVAEAGAVGGSIEDYDPGGFLYELPQAAERVEAAAEAARGLGLRSCSPAGPRTTSAATPTSTTRSRGSRPTSRPGRTCSTRPA